MKKYIITAAAGLAFVVLFILGKGIFNQTTPSAVFHILCDAFFVPGVCITGFGLLVF